MFRLLLLINGEWQECQSPMTRREAYRMGTWYRTHTDNVTRTRVIRED